MISLQKQDVIIHKMYNDINTKICANCIMISLHICYNDIITY
nr:MAG TPA: hypothetical protein [Caudoviricetes sp.]